MPVPERLTLTESLTRRQWGRPVAMFISHFMHESTVSVAGTLTKFRGLNVTSTVHDALAASMYPPAVQLPVLSILYWPLSVPTCSTRSLWPAVTVMVWVALPEFTVTVEKSRLARSRLNPTGGAADAPPAVSVNMPIARTE